MWPYKPGFEVNLTLKISISVKEGFSMQCVLFFKGGPKFYNGTGQKTVPNKRTCLISNRATTFFLSSYFDFLWMSFNRNVIILFEFIDLVDSHRKL